MIIVFHEVFPFLAGLVAGSLVLHELFSEGFYNLLEDVAWRVFQNAKARDERISWFCGTVAGNATTRKRTLQGFCHLHSTSMDLIPQLKLKRNRPIWSCH